MAPRRSQDAGALAAFLPYVEVLDFPDAAALHYAQIRADLKKRGALTGAIVDASVATPRSLAWLLSSFALSGLLLAAIGVFGVVSHAVTQRTREIGVRIAVGATPAQVVSMILGEGLVQLGLGIAIGTAIALGTARLLSGLLFGVTTASVTPYIAVAALLTIVTFAACLGPARRAMNVDPVTALRAE